jgi:hypothetical protein
MSNLLTTKLSNPSYVVVGALILLLLAAFPLAAAADHTNAVSLSGDAAYDPAAGGLAALSTSVEAASRSAVAVSLSGDAAYDPAAGGLAALSTFAEAASQGDVAECEPAGLPIAGSYSGDDAYDPAAGANPDAFALGLACIAPDTFAQ